jgi:hypothetical protein
VKELTKVTETGYLVWLIAMAVATISILTVGTLGAAEMLPHQQRDQVRRAGEEPGTHEVSP